jgi:hypothetical protein
MITVNFLGCLYFFSEASSHSLLMKRRLPLQEASVNQPGEGSA